MTHAELITLAERWLRKSARCPVVLADVRCNVVSEQPDAVGWRNNGLSYVVECKASRADFAVDARKMHRRFPERGMGAFRYYCAPFGLIDIEELPPRWGLLVPRRNGLHEHVKALHIEELDFRSEKALLVNALRRATEGWGRRIFGDAAPPLVDGDPHPTASKIIREQRIEIQRLREAALRGTSAKP